MDAINSTLRSLIDSRQVPSAQCAAELLRSFPYFVYPAAKIFSAHAADPDAPTSEPLRNVLLLNVGSDEALRRVFGPNTELFASFYPDSNAPSLSTGDAISTFIERFGPENAAAATEIPLTPAVDAISHLSVPSQPESAVEETEDATSQAISSFLHNNPAPVPAKSATQSKPSEPSALTESFAHILIRNGNYAKALEIIQTLSMANPNKSIYFADQIRFLRKLIKNQQSH